MGKPQQKRDPARPLDDPDEIREGVMRTGYPFEIELLSAFDAAGLDPTNGFRLRVADGTTRAMGGDDAEEASSLTREVDVMANVHVATVVVHPSTTGKTSKRDAVSARVVAMIEAKSLPSTAVLVGSTFKQPDGDHARRSLRLRFAGAPSYGVLPDFGETSGLALSLAEALDPLNEAPYCVQWVIIERNKSGDSLQQRHDWAVPLNNLVRGIQRHSIEHSTFLLSTETVRIDFFEPTLFVKTPTLYLFDAVTRKITTTDRFILSQYFEVAGGATEHRLIDVVAGGAAVDFTNRYTRIKANLEHLLHSPIGEQLVSAAKQQRERWRAKTTID